MTWFRVDDKFHDHPKVRLLGRSRLQAMGLWVLCAAWATDMRTDGFIPRTVVRRFDAKLRSAQRLVEVGLWTVSESNGEVGYQFHDWSEWQLSREQILDISRSRAEAGRRGGVRSGESRRAQAEANASSNERSKRSNTEPHPYPHPQRTATDVAVSTPESDAARPEPEPSTAPAKTEVADRFGEFYAAYPRRVDRRAAEKAWKAALKRKVDPQHLIDAAHAYAARAADTEPRFVKHPSTWLNAGAYDDDPEPARARPAYASPTDERIKAFLGAGHVSLHHPSQPALLALPGDEYP